VQAYQIFFPCIDERTEILLSTECEHILWAVKEESGSEEKSGEGLG